MAKVQPIPQGYHAVTPYLYLRNANAALDYYKKALGATELMRMPDPSEMSDEPWRNVPREHRFVPMQAKQGDYALFFRKAAVEITFEGETYLVIPQGAILALMRGDDEEEVSDEY